MANRRVNRSTPGTRVGQRGESVGRRPTPKRHFSDISLFCQQPNPAASIIFDRRPGCDLQIL
jgi:hypothetical protein